MKLNANVVISGIGVSQISRVAGRTAIELTVEAAHRALHDASLTNRDIDGVSTWPGSVMMTPGASGPSIAAVQDALNLSLTWYSATSEAPGGPYGAVANAVYAVAAGVCSNVLVYRTVTEGSGRHVQRSYLWYDELVPDGVGGYLEWLLPYGAVSAAHWLAPYATRYLHETGKGREDLFNVALNGRRAAATNPEAIYRSPLDLEQYLTAPSIVWPLCLFDCDVPVDASSALIVSAAASVNDTSRAIRIESIGTAMRGRPYYEHWADFTTMASHDAAEHTWTGIDLKPSDVQVAGLYDGFSIMPPLWAEATGLCARGEGLDFFAAAAAGSGSVLVNSDGGQLSAGRLHGFGLLNEVCRQLRGEAAAQPEKRPEVGLATQGGGPVAAAILLSR